MTDAHQTTVKQKYEHFESPNLRVCIDTPNFEVNKFNEFIDSEPSAAGRVLIQGLKPMQELVDSEPSAEGNVLIQGILPIQQPIHSLVKALVIQFVCMQIVVLLLSCRSQQEVRTRSFLYTSNNKCTKSVTNDSSRQRICLLATCPILRILTISPASRRTTFVLFVCMCVCLFECLFVCVLARSFVRYFVCLFCLFVCSFVRSAASFRKPFGRPLILCSRLPLAPCWFCRAGCFAWSQVACTRATLVRPACRQLGPQGFATWASGICRAGCFASARCAWWLCRAGCLASACLLASPAASASAAGRLSCALPESDSHVRWAAPCAFAAACLVAACCWLARGPPASRPRARACPDVHARRRRTRKKSRKPWFHAAQRLAPGIRSRCLPICQHVLALTSCIRCMLPSPPGCSRVSFAGWWSPPRLLGSPLVPPLPEALRSCTALMELVTPRTAAPPTMDAVMRSGVQSIGLAARLRLL